MDSWSEHLLILFGKGFRESGADRGTIWKKSERIKPSNSQLLQVHSFWCLQPPGSSFAEDWLLILAVTLSPGPSSGHATPGTKEEDLRELRLTSWLTIANYCWQCFPGTSLTGQLVREGHFHDRSLEMFWRLWEEKSPQCITKSYRWNLVDSFLGMAS